MKRFLLIISLFVPCYTIAQTISNGGFEKWNSITYENPNDWSCANNDMARRAGKATITKVAGVTGYAIKLETKSNGTEFAEAWISSSDGDPMAGEGGFPFSQKPTSITGKYMCNITGTDTGLFLVVFKKAGVVFDMKIFTIRGSVNSFTTFSYPLSLAQTPDSVIVAATSSNLISGEGVVVGSWLVLDDLAFGGTGITQTIPNGNFENWSTHSSDELLEWGDSHNENGPQKSSDAYRGYAALKLQTIKFSDGYVEMSQISLASYDNDGHILVSGVPYTLKTDTLFGYYKYSAGAGNDKAEVLVVLRGANYPGWGYVIPVLLEPKSEYTYFQIPFDQTMAPETLDVVISSSRYDVKEQGSTLIIDEIQLKSSPLNTTGLSFKQAPSADFVLYPNPAKDYLQLRLARTDNAGFSLYGANGQLLYQTQLSGSETYNIPLPAVQAGLYFVTIQTSDGKIQHRKLLIE